MRDKHKGEAITEIVLSLVESGVVYIFHKQKHTSDNFCSIIILITTRAVS